MVLAQRFAEPRSFVGHLLGDEDEVAEAARGGADDEAFAHPQGADEEDEEHRGDREEHDEAHCGRSHGVGGESVVPAVSAHDEPDGGDREVHDEGGAGDSCGGITAPGLLGGGDDEHDEEGRGDGHHLDDVGELTGAEVDGAESRRGQWPADQQPAEQGGAAGDPCRAVLSGGAAQCCGEAGGADAQRGDRHGDAGEGDGLCAQAGDADMLGAMQPDGDEQGDHRGDAGDDPREHGGEAGVRPAQPVDAALDLAEGVVELLVGLRDLPPHERGEPAEQRALAGGEVFAGEGGGDGAETLGGVGADCCRFDDGEALRPARRWCGVRVGRIRRRRRRGRR